MVWNKGERVWEILLPPHASSVPTMPLETCTLARVHGESEQGGGNVVNLCSILRKVLGYRPRAAYSEDSGRCHFRDIFLVPMSLLSLFFTF